MVKLWAKKRTLTLLKYLLAPGMERHTDAKVSLKASPSLARVITHIGRVKYNHRFIFAGAISTLHRAKDVHILGMITPDLLPNKAKYFY